MPACLHACTLSTGTVVYRGSDRPDAAMAGSTWCSRDRGTAKVYANQVFELKATSDFKLLRVAPDTIADINQWLRENAKEIIYRCWQNWTQYSPETGAAGFDKYNTAPPMATALSLVLSKRGYTGIEVCKGFFRASPHDTVPFHPEIILFPSCIIKTDPLDQTRGTIIPRSNTPDPGDFARFVSWLGKLATGSALVESAMNELKMNGFSSKAIGLVGSFSGCLLKMSVECVVLAIAFYCYQALNDGRMNEDEASQLLVERAAQLTIRVACAMLLPRVVTYLLPWLKAHWPWLRTACRRLAACIQHAS
eukprot:m.291499 g.291499  ORF g.291499 m.291499 type:complete len:307 (+) comp19476_c2_seq1:318-1238(+)